MLLPENMTREHKMLLFCVGLVLSLLALFLATKTWLTIREAKQVGKPVPYEYTISVEGIGEATAIPDVAKMTYSIESRAATTQESQDKNTAIGNNIIARLATEGIEKKDVKTTYYNFYQNYIYDEFGNAKPGGDWITNQSVEVTIRDMAKVSSVLSLLGELGATGISGPVFEVDDDEAAKDEARNLAIEDVKEKAEVIAAQLGLKLKQVSSYSEWQDSPYYGYEMGGTYASEGMKVEGASPTVEPGEKKIKLHVTVSYVLDSSK